MSDGTILNYIYDGSFDGLLCCALESCRTGERPEFIKNENEDQLSLFSAKYIKTDEKRAACMSGRIKSSVSKYALDFIKKAFLTCLEDKEMYILDFIREGFKKHAQVMNDLNGAWYPLFKAVRELENEVEAYRGFVRFSELGNALVSVIEPKNYILPMLMTHFCPRYPDDTIIIYDKTHKMILLGSDGQGKIAYIDEFEPAAPGSFEMETRKLWQNFYNSIGIKERYNPKCRMGNIPKRFWAQMTEFWENGAPPVRAAGVENTMKAIKA